ncbi:MAG TPA: GyrI-like domain-containing protein [Ktedonobacteraceae bacterium]|jgi:effector-binding domain-containing protein|nr:GyrI-like domain-containing protein [Ktedonobacteraceae bacterium]
MKTTEPQITEREVQHYVGIRTQVPMQEMGSGVIPRLHQEVFAWMQKQGVFPAGAPFIRYYVINMPGLLDIEMGWPVASALSGNERIRAGVLSAGRYASLIYTGVENGIAGNKVLIDWGTEKGLVWDRRDDAHGDAFGSRFESFLTDPRDEPDMAKWETEVAIRLADD